MTQTVPVEVPDIGDFKNIPVIEVLVKVGDTVAVDDSLVTLESDKATLDVPSSVAGVISELRLKVGDRVSQGSVVALVKVGAGETAAAPAATPDVGWADKPNMDAHIATDVGLPTSAQPTAAPPAKVEGGAPSLASDYRPGDADLVTAPLRLSMPSATAALGDDVPHASPSVRRFARELGADIAQVKGSGPKGRITQSDVQQFVKARLGAAATPVPVAAAPTNGGGLNLLPWPKVDFAKFGAVSVQPLSRIQKLSAANLARNWAMIPHVTQFDEADITDLEAFRQTINQEVAAAGGVKLTMLAFLVVACVAALKKYPDFNASLEESDGELRRVLKQYFHIGFAADTPQGLVVPVVRNADAKNISALAREMGELAHKARQGKLAPTEMQGGCFTISSLGGIGGTAFTPIINAPEIAILGVSQAQTKPVWNGQAFAPRLMLPLSLSYDHRLIDGASAARFTRYLVQVLADLRRSLL